MISALSDLRINDLIDKIDELVINNYKNYEIKINYDSLKNIDYIYRNSIVLDRLDDYDFIKFKISCNTKNYNRIIKKIGLK